MRTCENVVFVDVHIHISENNMLISFAYIVNIFQYSIQWLAHTVLMPKLKLQNELENYMFMQHTAMRYLNCIKLASRMTTNRSKLCFTNV